MRHPSLDKKWNLAKLKKTNLGANKTLGSRNKNIGIEHSLQTLRKQNQQ
jgi:hypothetical protein